MVRASVSSPPAKSTFPPDRPRYMMQDRCVGNCPTSPTEVPMSRFVLLAALIGIALVWSACDIAYLATMEKLATPSAISSAAV